MNKPILYILMRNDLGTMSPGRACAQASHAANAFIHKFGKRKDVKEWQNKTKQGFGTAIVLSTSSSDLTRIASWANRNKVPFEDVIDPTYRIRVPAEVANLIDVEKGVAIQYNYDKENTADIYQKINTCAYLFGDKDRLTEIVGKLPLY
jgi:peptidyl-tRNA hydrolase